MAHVLLIGLFLSVILVIGVIVLAVSVMSAAPDRLRTVECRQCNTPHNHPKRPAVLHLLELPHG
jgi:hypothetical protein